MGLFARAVVVGTAAYVAWRAFEAHEEARALAKRVEDLHGKLTSLGAPDELSAEPDPAIREAVRRAAGPWVGS